MLKLPALICKVQQSESVFLVLQNLALQHCTGYKPSELKDCVLVIHELQSGRRAASVQAVRKKYMDHKVHSLDFDMKALSNVPSSFFGCEF